SSTGALIPAFSAYSPPSYRPASSAAGSKEEVLIAVSSRSARMPRVEYSARYPSSICSTSGASPPATWVASLSQYPPQSPGSAEIVTSGATSLYASSAALVSSSRFALPHQAKRSEPLASPPPPPPPLLAAFGPQAARPSRDSEAAVAPRTVRRAGRRGRADIGAPSLEGRSWPAMRRVRRHLNCVGTPTEKPASRTMSDSVGPNLKRANRFPQADMRASPPGARRAGRGYLNALESFHVESAGRVRMTSQRATRAAVLLRLSASDDPRTTMTSTGFPALTDATAISAPDLDGRAPLL